MKLTRSSICTKIVIRALIVYGAVLLINTRNQVAAAEADRAALQARVDEMQQKNAELDYDIAHAADPEIIAEVARSKLGLVLPGEKVFYDLNNQ